MKNTIYLTALTFVVSVFIFISCSDSKEKSDLTPETTKPIIAKTGVEIISMNDVTQKMAEPNMQILDVRSPEEFEDGHLKNAINMNVNGESFQSEVEKLSKENPVIVYCKSGTRSTNASSQMEAMGFKTIYNFTGGFSEWAANGNEIEE